MNKLPFTVDQFLQVFSAYNQAIWPVHLIAYLLSIGAIILLLRKTESAGKYMTNILGLFWIWMGLVYHIIFFAEINVAAYFFGALFVLQGIAFMLSGRMGNKIQYKFRKDIYSITGIIFTVYAMIVYPLVGHLLGHTYPQSPVFGVAPCPTTIFTFGILLQAKEKIPFWLLAIPALWSLIGFSAAYQLTIYEDMGLVVAGLLGTGMIIYRNTKSKPGFAYKKL